MCLVRVFLAWEPKSLPLLHADMAQCPGLEVCVCVCVCVFGPGLTGRFISEMIAHLISQETHLWLGCIRALVTTSLDSVACAYKNDKSEQAESSLMSRPRNFSSSSCEKIAQVSSHSSLLISQQISG